jgi:hypothetical protein
MTLLNNIIGWGVVVGSLALIWYCPLFKSWFGFCRPEYTKNDPKHGWFK